MPIKQSVLKDCPKIKDGTLNATGFRMLDREDERILFQLKDPGACGCIMRCCNGRYTECDTFRDWATRNDCDDLLNRDPSTMKRKQSHIQGEK